MDILKESISFRDLIRKDLSEVFKKYSYKLTFDNTLENQEESKNWVFKLSYKGNKLIEIYNEDWRDFTEYFNVSVNGEEIFYVKINDYQSLAEAFEILKFKIQNLLE